MSLNALFGLNGGMIAAFLVFGGTALFDAKCLRKNDYFDGTAILKAMFGILDVVSDVKFSYFVSEKHFESHSVPNVLVLSCWASIAIPIFLSLMQLSRKSRGSWLREDIARHWISKHSMILYVLPILSGSAFVAIALLNSNAFQLDLFSMGLSKAELDKFGVQRVWSIVILEV